MADGSRRPFLVAYDIRAPRRWRRLFRGLKRVAIPIQYSLFYGEFTAAGLARVVALVEEVIDPRADDVRIYPLPRGGWQARIGRPVLPAGIGFTGLPAAFRAPVAGPDGAGSPAPPAPPERVAGPRGREARAIEARAQTGQRRGIRVF